MMNSLIHVKIRFHKATLQKRTEVLVSKVTRIVAIWHTVSRHVPYDCIASSHSVATSSFLRGPRPESQSLPVLRLETALDSQLACG